MERLPTLDAYAGLADQVHVNSQLFEAVYRLDEWPTSVGQAPYMHA